MELKNFAERNKINVIIATPLKFDTVHFDRIIDVKKEIGFSVLNED